MHFWIFKRIILRRALQVDFSFFIMDLIKDQMIIGLFLNFSLWNLVKNFFISSFCNFFSHFLNLCRCLESLNSFAFSFLWRRRALNFYKPRMLNNKMHLFHFSFFPIPFLIFDNLELVFLLLPSKVCPYSRRSSMYLSSSLLKASLIRWFLSFVGLFIMWSHVTSSLSKMTSYTEIRSSECQSY